MRTGPVALAHLGDRESVAGLAAEVAALTHPHPDSVDACVLWSLAIEHAITNAGGDDAFDWIGAVTAGLDHLDPARRGVWRDRIAEAAGADPEQWSRSNGWVVAAFQAALGAITVTPLPDELSCTHLQDALVRAARAGGDTDTVAAIAGALLGARWGGTAVPIGWRSRLVGRRSYDEVPLPAVKLDAMARLAIRGGRPDSVEWPGVDQLLPYYLANFDSVPRLHEIDGAWFGNVAALPAALDCGATVVVSLCRMGTQDVPAAVAHDVVGLLDTTAADNPNLVFVLADTAAHVANLVDAGQRVFVHCVAAENRTPAVAAAFLHARGATPAAALATVASTFGREPQRFLCDGVRALGA